MSTVLGIVAYGVSVLVVSMLGSSMLVWHLRRNQFRRRDGIDIGRWHPGVLVGRIRR